MAITNLPADLLPQKNKNSKIVFYKYAPESITIKGKSILHKNLISLLIDGEKTVYFSDTVFTINNDELFMLSSGNFLSTERQARNGRFNSILVFFDNSVFTDFKIKYSEKIRELSIKKNTQSAAYLTVKKDEFIRNYITSLKLMLDNGMLLSEDMKQLKLEELFLYLLYTDAKRFLMFNCLSEKEAYNFEIENVIEANIASNTTVEELAFLCNMSLSTFKRHFASVYNTSPNKWILQKRMNHAKDLLKNTDHKPSDIYYRVGYENHSSFTETFKQTFGITPRQYQLQIMNE